MGSLPVTGTPILDITPVERRGRLNYDNGSNPAAVSGEYAHEPCKLVPGPWGDDRLCHLDPQGGRVVAPQGL